MYQPAHTRDLGFAHRGTEQAPGRNTEGETKTIGQRSNNNALGLEKSSKARHSPAVLINLIKKSWQAYESFMTLH